MNNSSSSSSSDCSGKASTVIFNVPEWGGGENPGQKSKVLQALCFCDIVWRGDAQPFNRSHIQDIGDVVGLRVKALRAQRMRGVAQIMLLGDGMGWIE